MRDHQKSAPTGLALHPYSIDTHKSDPRINRTTAYPFLISEALAQLLPRVLHTEALLHSPYAAAKHHIASYPVEPSIHVSNSDCELLAPSLNLLPWLAWSLHQIALLKICEVLRGRAKSAFAPPHLFHRSHILSSAHLLRLFPRPHPNHHKSTESLSATPDLRMQSASSVPPK